MVSYRYLGSALTNANGVATFDYQGTGAGEIDVIASLDKPIVDGSIVSETLPVYDAWMRDGGVTGDVNNDDWLVQTGGSRTVGSDGTVFSGDTGSLFAWINKHGTTHSGLTDIAEYSGDYGIELTVVEINGSARCSIYEAYPSPKRVDIPLSVGKWRITRINNVVTAYKDGVLTPITSLNLNAPQRIGIITSQGDSVKLRDIAVYGLGGTELGLTASKQVIESGETTTLSAYLSEGSGNTVQLYNADTDTLIDTMTDVGNGQYTYTVTGTGSGQKRYYATYGSTVSGTFNVIDGTFLDRGTDSDYSAWTNTDFTGDAISRNGEYTTLTPQDDFDSQYLALADSDLCIEFDMNLTSSASINFIRFVKNQWTSTAQINQNDLGINSNTWHHIKLAKSGNTVNIFVDNVEKTPKTLSDTTDGFRIVLSNTQVTDMKYKNFVVYPI